MPDLMIALGEKKKGPPPYPGAPGKPKMSAPPPFPKDDGDHPEPDADQQGGPSDNDADNNIAQYAEEIAAVPELAHPLGTFLAAMCEYVRSKGGAGQMPEQDEEYGG